MRPPPPRSTLFPYTTLFRSRADRRRPELGRPVALQPAAEPPERRANSGDEHGPAHGNRGYRRLPRSEEHTSELQSLTNLVCRLLLEKKKKRKASASILIRYK